MKERKKTPVELIADKIYIFQRISALLLVVLIFLPGVSPIRIAEIINKNNSLFTAAVSYDSLTDGMGNAFRRGWLAEGTMQMLYIGAIVMVVGILFAAAAGCFSLGNLRTKRLGNIFGICGSIILAVGTVIVYLQYLDIQYTPNPGKVGPMFPTGFIVFMVLGIIFFLSTLIALIILVRSEVEAEYEMESKYKLFLMFLPFAALCFVFAYLPLWGWRYAFFDYSAGGTLTADKFVGFKWFTSLFESPATRSDVVRVLRNTLVMSGLGIITSWLPMAFAIFLCEIKNMKLRRVIQTFTTIPNFISWVMVYAIAFAIFSTDGFVNTFAAAVGILPEGVAGTNYLMDSSGIWFKMLLWGIWKGIGWSAIIYIAGISGIDQQLYEAATVDGAGRFQRMWHVTVPGLMPTYFVMLLMSIANILSNGMDQYLVFENKQNTAVIEVLDLYVYHLGIGNGNIPLSTVIGMVKSIVSVVLLFAANRVSKTVRGESIV